MSRWSYNVQLQHTCPLLRPDGSETKVWRTHADRLTDLQQPQICEDLIHKDSPVTAHGHWGGKLTLWQPAISIGIWHTPLPMYSWCVQKGSMAGTLPSLSIQGPTAAVWVLRSKSMAVSQDQRAGTPFTHSTCESMLTLCTSGKLQEGDEKWLSATAAKQIPPLLFRIWCWIQPDPAHNTPRCEHPDGLFVGFSYKRTG